MSQSITPPKALGGLTGLARSIALPHEFQPVRYPSFPALERTALIGFNTPTTWVVPSGSVRKAAVARQAAYPLWYDLSYTGSSYSLTWTTNVPGTALGYSVPVAGQPLQWGLGNATASVSFFGVSGSNVGPTLPIVARDTGCGPTPFIYVPAGWTLTPAAAGNMAVEWASGTNNYTLVCEVWTAPGEVTEQRFAATLSAGTRGVGFPSTSFTNGVWVRPRLFERDSSVGMGLNTTMAICLFVSAGSATYTGGFNYGTFAVTPATVVSLMPASVPLEFNTSSLPWQSARTTATSCLFTNVSQVLSKGGTVLCGRVSPDVGSMWVVPSSYVSGLHPAEKAYLGLETGAYTYVPPSTDMSDFWDYTCTVGSLSSSMPLPCYRLDNTSLVNIMFFTAPPADVSLAINLDWHMEFRTSSVLFQIGLSTLTIETLHQAQITLANVGFFFENFNHKAVLAAVIAAARKLCPALGAAVDAYQRKSRKGRKGKGKGGKDIQLSSKPKASLPATSARQSGITGPKRKGGLEMYLASKGRK